MIAKLTRKVTGHVYLSWYAYNYEHFLTFLLSARHLHCGSALLLSRSFSLIKRKHFLVIEVAKQRKRATFLNYGSLQETVPRS